MAGSTTNRPTRNSAAPSSSNRAPSSPHQRKGHMLRRQPAKLSLAACQTPTSWKKMRAGAKVIAISRGTSKARNSSRQSMKPCACSGVTVRVSGS
ncbi:hypothetical protein D3C86_2028280 [compost metagenome]